METVTINTRTREGQERAKALLESGWILGPIDCHTVQLYKHILVQTGWKSDGQLA